MCAPCVCDVSDDLKIIVSSLFRSLQDALSYGWGLCECFVIRFFLICMICLESGALCVAFVISLCSQFLKSSFPIFRSLRGSLSSAGAVRICYSLPLALVTLFLLICIICINRCVRHENQLNWSNGVPVGSVFPSSFISSSSQRLFA